MDRLHGHDVAQNEEDFDPFDDAAIDAPLPVASQDRRMQMRAYDYWTSLLGQRDLPAIADLAPERLQEFGPNCVLLDFSQGLEDPMIAYLGSSLQTENPGIGAPARIADVPAGSLLSRLTDHYQQVVARAAPVMRESEFLDEEGASILYRGLLMPFASDGRVIDAMLGVINWKARVSIDENDAIEREMRAAMRSVSAPRAVAPLWGNDDEPGTQSAPMRALRGDAGPAPTLAERLAHAREGAARARMRQGRSNIALYQALGLAHDLALAAQSAPQALALLLGEAGIAVRNRSIGAVIAQLVFGNCYSRSRWRAFGHMLDQAVRMGTGEGELADHLAASVDKRNPLQHAARPLEGRARSEPPIVRFAATMDPSSISTDADGLMVIVAQRESDGAITLRHALSPRAARRAIASLTR